MRLAVLAGLLAALAPEPLLPGQPYVLRGHSEAVTALAFSPDGGSLASAARDRSVRVWSLATGETTLTIPGAEEQINALAFSADGSRLAVGETALKVRVISVPEGRVVGEFAHPDSVSDLSFSPDGALLAVAGERNSGAVYVLATGKAKYPFRGRSAQFSKDGASLLVGSTAGTLSVLEARTGKVRRSASTAPHLPFARWVGDGARIASWCPEEPSAHLWDGKTLAAGAVLTAPASLDGARARLIGLSPSPDGRTALTGSSQALRLWDLEQRAVSRTWPVEQAAVLVSSPGWIAAGDGSLVKLWKAH